MSILTSTLKYGTSVASSLQLLKSVGPSFSCSIWRMITNNSSGKPLKGRVALVTGGSRGVSRGIALQLAEAGAKIYVTGREPSKSDSTKQSGYSSLEDTMEEIAKRGGDGVKVYCDYSDANQIEDLFKKISSENNDTLDILVNAAFSGNASIEKNAQKKFYECDPLFWDDINNVGLRSVYICCVYAGRLMVPKQRGLIVNISSAGSLQYFFNVPYGVGKTAIDRMSADMAFELRSSGVTVVSLWPGTVKTETTKKLVYSGKFSAMTGVPQKSAMKLLDNGETPEFVGKAVVALASDINVFRRTGKILLTGDLSTKYGFTDINGQRPLNMRSLSGAMDFMGFSTFANIIPRSLKVPSVALHLSTYKF